MGDLFLARTGRLEARFRDGRLVVRFTSPSSRNSLSTEVLSTLEELISHCESDVDIPEIVFTGSGDAFASGADLHEIGALPVEDAPSFSLRGQRLMDRIERLGARTIASVNGYCYGGGMDLALACNERIANTKATFCHPGTGLGIITGWGGTQRLPRLIGEALALEMFFTARPFNAKRALSIGLIDAIDDEIVSKLSGV